MLIYVRRAMSASLPTNLLNPVNLVNMGTLMDVLAANKMKSLSAPLSGNTFYSHNPSGFGIINDSGLTHPPAGIRITQNGSFLPFKVISAKGQVSFDVKLPHDNYPLGGLSLLPLTNGSQFNIITNRPAPIPEPVLNGYLQTEGDGFDTPQNPSFDLNYSGGVTTSLYSTETVAGKSSSGLTNFTTVFRPAFITGAYGAVKSIDIGYSSVPNYWMNDTLKTFVGGIWPPPMPDDIKQTVFEAYSSEYFVIQVDSTLFSNPTTPEEDVFFSIGCTLMNEAVTPAPFNEAITPVPFNYPPFVVNLQGDLLPYKSRLQEQAVMSLSYFNSHTQTPNLTGSTYECAVIDNFSMYRFPVKQEYVFSSQPFTQNVMLTPPPIGNYSNPVS